jgi:hypothetical protein
MSEEIKSFSGESSLYFIFFHVNKTQWKEEKKPPSLPQL